MENPIKMDDLGVPLFLETPTWNLRIHLIEEEKSSSKPSFSGSMLIFQGVITIQQVLVCMSFIYMIAIVFYLYIISLIRYFIYTVCEYTHNPCVC